MIDYTGIKCPVCDIPFKKNDDIVVCPICGAPYHRNCYHEAGGCVFEEELHSSGKSWEAPKPPEPPDLKSEIKDQECPNCGTLNAHSSLFCNRCGASLQEVKPPHQNRQDTSPGSVPPRPPTPQGFGGMPFAPMEFDSMGGVSPTETLDDNVSFGDASKLVKQNTVYYMPVFRYMKQSGKNKFNFCAFLCSGPWMLYRKQYKAGTIITILLFALYLAKTFLTIFVSDPILLDLMEQVGIDTTVAISLTPTQLQDITGLLMDDPSNYLALLPLACNICIFIIMIFIGFNGNKMYMNHCIKTAKAIKSDTAITDTNAAIEERGGVNIGIAICMFVCYAILSNISLFI